jgi:hypothetical protein
MLTYIFIEESMKQDERTKLNDYIIFLINFMFAMNIPLSIKNFIHCSDDIHMLQLIDEIKEKGKLTSNNNVRSQYTIKYLSEKYSSFDKNLIKSIHIVFNDLGFMYNEKISHERGFTIKEIISEPTEKQDKNIILIIRTTSRSNITINHLIQRLIISDLHINADYNAKQRALSKTKTVISVTSKTDIFPTIDFAKIFLNDFSAKFFSLGFEIESVKNIDKNFDGLCELLINFCKTMIIHTTFDKKLIELITKNIENEHVKLVIPNFQYLNIKFRQNGPISNQDDFKKQISHTKKKLISEIPYFEKKGKAIFKTIYIPENKYEEILYNEPIECVKFENISKISATNLHINQKNNNNSNIQVSDITKKTSN